MLSLIGITLGLLGTIILAFSLNRLLKSFDSSIKALEIFKETITQKNTIDIIGLDKHRAIANSKSKKNVIMGLLFIIVGFVFQLIDIIIQLKF